jgi:hypothetical protein
MNKMEWFSIFLSVAALVSSALGLKILTLCLVGVLFIVTLAMVLYFAAIRLAKIADGQE